MARKKRSQQVAQAPLSIAIYTESEVQEVQQYWYKWTIPLWFNLGDINIYKKVIHTVRKAHLSEFK